MIESVGLTPNTPGPPSFLLLPTAREVFPWTESRARGKNSAQDCVCTPELRVCSPLKFHIDRSRPNRRNCCSFKPARTVLMGWVDKKIGFLRDHRTGHSQNKRIGLRKPFVADCLRCPRRWVRTPVIREAGFLDGNDQMFVYSGRNCDVILEQRLRVYVYENFEHGKREGLRGVDYRMTGGIPTPTEAACSFPRKGILRESSLDDSPSDNRHGKTPCSSWPMRFSTSRAPSSVAE